MSGVPLFLKISAAVSTLIFGAGAVWLVQAGHFLVNGSAPVPIDPRCTETEDNPYAFLCIQARQEGMGIAVYHGQTVFFFESRDIYYLEQPVRVGSLWTGQVLDEFPPDALPTDFHIIDQPHPRP